MNLPFRHSKSHSHLARSKFLRVACGVEHDHKEDLYSEDHHLEHATRHWSWAIQAFRWAIIRTSIIIARYF